MDNRGGKVAVSILEQPEAENTITTVSRENEEASNSNKKKWTKKLMEILKQEGIHPMWTKLFVLACVFAVSLDPLFFYIPTINEELKCFDMDKSVKISALVWRSFFDLIYVMDIVYNITRAYKLKIEKSDGVTNRKTGIQLTRIGIISWSLIVVDFLAILPVPQVIIFVQLTKLSKRPLPIRKYLNVVLFSQYVPRVLRIYISCKELTKRPDKLAGTVWVKGIFNLFLYILASHVFGAFWYFFSFQRETSCWYEACDDKAGDAIYKSCTSGTSHYCGHRGDQEDSKSIAAFLNSSCPIEPENVDSFNFGIFLDALKSGVLGPKYNFSRRFFYCFWWGLQNMSSLGQNLKTSTYIWENIFAASIALSGLLLFLYLIGNLQTYLQLATIRSEEVRHKMKLKELDIELWIEKNGLDKHIKTSIMREVKNKLQENRDVDVENLFSILPREEKERIRRQLCLPTIKKVPLFQNMNNNKLLEKICDHLKPVIYNENSHIIGEGDPLDRMLFITQGSAWMYTKTSFNINNRTSTSSSTNIRRLEKGDYFGEELVNWSLTHTTISDFPISTTNLKSHTKVEAFVLMADDFKNAVDKHWWRFRRNLPDDSIEYSQEKRWEDSALRALKQFRHHNQLAKKSATSSSQSTEDGEGRSKRFRYLRLRH